MNAPLATGMDFPSLTQSEAEALRAAEGPNEWPSGPRRGAWGLVVETLREPTFLLLVACGLLYAFLGDRQEALLLLGFVVLITIITLVQEHRAERALAALRDLSSPRALVVRDGVQRRIAGRDVVRGDLLVLVEGDRVPADGLLLSSAHLAVDESLLTGEAVPVRKEARPPHPQESPLQATEPSPYVFAGTLVTQGQGFVRATHTGGRSEIGKIGRALTFLAPGPTRLQQEMSRLVKTVGAAAIGLCGFVLGIFVLKNGQWLPGVLSALSLAMALVPNEFPVVLTIFLSLGAWRLSRYHVLARRMPAVESLGAVTVLCVDKTGTLTENRMEIQRILPTGQQFEVTPASSDLPEAFHEILEFGILASARNPFDPMEKAFHALGDRFLADTEHIHREWRLIKEYPLSGQLLAMSQVWASPDQRHFVIAAKGAPEAIGDLCHFSPKEMETLRQEMDRHAQEGLRLLGIARASFEQEKLPPGQHDFDFTFLGLIALADPVRASVPEAIAECHRAGIRVIMITGDSPGTAQSVARAIGLPHPEDVLSGAELEQMTDTELARRLRHGHVFARAVPEQKLRLVQALRANGEVVAMTGDGVNDAPALKAADIGVAMGERGTDVARETADLVLLKDDFASLVDAVKLGRRVFDNLNKGMAYILAIHVPIAGLSLLPPLLGGPLVLLPVHIAFLHLIIDPACSIVFEADPENPDVMRRPPRSPETPLFGSRTLALPLLQGTSILLATFLLYTFALKSHRGDETIRVLTFTALMVANLGLVVAHRSRPADGKGDRRPFNFARPLLIAGTLLLLALVITVPPLQHLFYFSPLSLRDLLLCLGTGAGSLVVFEIGKKGFQL